MGKHWPSSFFAGDPVPSRPLGLPIRMLHIAHGRCQLYNNHFFCFVRSAGSCTAAVFLKVIVNHGSSEPLWAEKIIKGNLCCEFDFEFKVI